MSQDMVVSTIIGGSLAGVITALVLAILWGAACYWVDWIFRNWVRVRPRQ